MKLSPEGLQLLLDWEVGGGKEYYEKHCAHPTVPDPEHTSSGITIGIGFDLGQCSPATFQAQWFESLPTEQLAALAKACFLRSSNAVRYLPAIRYIRIPWETALAQFERFEVPRFFALTEVAFPGVADAPQAVQEALLSLVYNRGTSMRGERRLEMREIRHYVNTGRWIPIPSRIRSMKRLWPNTNGLLNRREAEARHIERGLKAGKE